MLPQACPTEVMNKDFRLTIVHSSSQNYCSTVCMNQRDARTREQSRVRVNFKIVERTVDRAFLTIILNEAIKANLILLR